MEYELTITDRVVLGQLLPAVTRPSTYLFYKNLNKVREEVSFSDEAERKMIGFTVDKKSKALRWKPGAVDHTKKVKISEPVRAAVAEVLIQYDKEERIMPEHFPVYEKFVKDEDLPEPVEEQADAEV